RRAGILYWETFRDDGDVVPPIPGWSGAKEFWDNVRRWAEDYFRTPDGDVFVEIWVETGGMAPEIQEIGDEFGVRVIPSGGFSSSTARRNAAGRLIKIGKHKRVIILLIGDYDPSGQSIMDSAAEDILAFGAEVTFDRLAVTPEQAEIYNLESAPQKETDNRGEYMAETYQAEALDPDVLADIVRTRLLELIGEENLTEAQRLSEIEQAELLTDIEKISPNEKE